MNVGECNVVYSSVDNLIQMTIVEKNDEQIKYRVIGENKDRISKIRYSKTNRPFIFSQGYKVWLDSKKRKNIEDER